MKKKVITHNQEETMNLAAEIAGKLQGGEVLALNGELGGGKTTFTKGLAEALRVEETITSPTFVMLKNYDGKIDKKNIQFVHIDAYRADTIEDIKSIGIEDYLGRDDVVMVVEWAKKIQEILPSDIINIEFKFVDENSREITYDFGN
jgi:tRNA threonylcarbamoyladenosine biosynthesis protein TsaE